MLHTELLLSIKHGELADYISANYYKWEKEDLKEVIVQLVCTLYDNGMTESKIDVYELMDRLDYEYYNKSY